MGTLQRSSTQELPAGKILFVRYVVCPHSGSLQLPVELNLVGTRTKKFYLFTICVVTMTGTRCLTNNTWTHTPTCRRPREHTLNTIIKPKEGCSNSTISKQRRSQGSRGQPGSSTNPSLESSSEHWNLSQPRICVGFLSVKVSSASSNHGNATDAHIFCACMVALSHTEICVRIAPTSTQMLYRRVQYDRLHYNTTTWDD